MDEKTKLIILGALGVAFVGYGIYMFLPKGEPEPAVVAKESDETEPTFVADQTTKETPKNPALAIPLARRDPFAMPMAFASALYAANSAGSSASTPPSSFRPTAPIRNGNFAVNTSGAFPMPDASGPVALSTGANGVGNEVTAAPLPFAYRVAGIVLGRVPAAVFVDAQGNQQLVVQGASIDGDSTVKAVRLKEVVVSYLGKTLRLPVGEGTNAQ
jgi:hypothetical protein